MGHDTSINNVLQEFAKKASRGNWAIIRWLFSAPLFK